MFKIHHLLLFAGISLSFLMPVSRAQNNSSSKIKEQPKLVVGIVVDQMRYDYLTRFWNHYGDGGFKKMVNQGFNCKNNHYNYAPTSTGPGHASIYTGTTPSTHGVIGNSWYDKDSGQIVYCASDDTYNSVGTTANTGKMSPHRMTVTTITDELRLFTQKRGKVIAVALKDRGAVLPGGHLANAAYWFNGGAEGDWISSTYYMEELPRWVKNFNRSDAGEKYIKVWDTYKDINTYVESGDDNNSYEAMFSGESAAVFPHNLPAIWEANNNFELLKATPYGNSLTTDFALAALDGEDLGKDMITDFLAISYSSTDYVGHQFGVNSKEIQDTYIRLDQDLARLFTVLDSKVGAGEYLVFLTADHGAIDVPAYLRDQKAPAGYMKSQEMSKRFTEFMSNTYGGANLLKNYSNTQLFLDHDVIRDLKLKVEDVQKALGEELLQYDGISRYFTGTQLLENEYSRGIPYIIQNGYNQKRSGDVVLVLDPGVVYYPETGSTHGSPYPYDTHVPLLFYGQGIPQGSTVERTEISDIAPTIAAILGIAFPSGTSGIPIEEVLE